MWKVFDPFCKCAAYFTDEEEAFDRQKVERALRSMNSATPVKAIIEGQEMALWKVIWEPERGIVASYYLTGDEKKFISDSFELYLKAHAQRVRVEVTARELRGVAAPEKLPEWLTNLAPKLSHER